MDSYTRVVLAVAALLLVASAQAELYGECVDAFNRLGGGEAMGQHMPTCKTNLANIKQCCAEAKATLQLGPGGCLCDAAVWSEVERRLLGASIPGLTSNTLRAFANFCGIRNHGSGTC